MKLILLIAGILSAGAAFADSQAIVTVRPVLTKKQVPYSTGTQIGTSAIEVKPYVDRQGQVLNLAQITVEDLSPTGGPMDIFFFTGGPPATAGTDHQTADMTDAQGSSCVGVLSIANSDYKGFVSNSTATIQASNIVLNMDTSRGSFWILPVARGFFSYTDTQDLIFKIGLQPFIP